MSEQPKLYIVAGNTTYNRGDRGNLFSQITMLKKRWPKAHITIESFLPERDRHWFDVATVKRSYLPNRQQRRGLRQADLIIWGGGALLADNASLLTIPYWLAFIAYCKLILRKPVMAWAHGFVINTPLGNATSRLILKWVDVITVRDEQCYHKARRLGVPSHKLHQTADPAILITPASPTVGRRVLHDQGIPQTKDKPLICLSPTYWPFYYRETNLIPFFVQPHRRQNRQRAEKVAGFNQALAKLCDQLVEHHQATIVLLPHYPAPWPDTKHLQHVKSNTKHSPSVHLFDSDQYSPAEFYAIYHCFDLLIGIALHDTIFATALDRPCLNLYYEPKGREFFKALNALDRTCSWHEILTDQGRHHIMTLANRALTKQAARPDHTRRHTRILQTRARDHITILEKLLTQHPTTTNHV